MFYISDIKERAKSRLQGEWGAGILYAVGPTFLMSIFTVVSSFLLSFLLEIDSYAVIIIGLLLWVGLVSVLGIVTQFMSVNLIVQFTRYDKDIEFFTGWKPLKSLAWYALYSVMFVILVIIISVVIFFTLFSSTIDLFIDMDLASPVDIALLMNRFILFYLVNIAVVLIVQIKFMFVGQIIVHEEVGVLTAISKSWELTNKNFFRLIGFYLSFLGWYILSQFTYGLVLLYLLPYYTVSKTILYFELLGEDYRESRFFEEDDEPAIEVEVEKEEDPFEL